MDTTSFTYIGPPAYAGALAQELEANGLSADYEPPFETKDAATAMAAVAVVFAVTGPMKDILAGVRPFKARFAGTQIDGLQDPDRRTAGRGAPQRARTSGPGRRVAGRRADRRR